MPKRVLATIFMADLERLRQKRTTLFQNQSDSPKVPIGLPYKVRVNTGALHCRRGAGTENPVIGQIHKGEIYTITAEAYGLWIVKMGAAWVSEVGWIALDYCTKVW